MASCKYLQTDTGEPRHNGAYIVRLLAIHLTSVRRSLQNFDIGGPAERLPVPLIKAFGVLKKAASIVNVEYGMEAKVGEAIQKAADDVNMSFSSR